MDIAIGLKLHTQEFQQKYVNGYQIIIDVYRTRHDIVHQDKLAINTPEEVSVICAFLSGFMIDFAVTAGKQFGISTDFDLLFKSSGKVDIE